ncbi:MAG: amidohydrolase [Chloroflexi bacterium]|nr:amidohydrolase [Chloroflexota bacterium]
MIVDFHTHIFPPEVKQHREDFLKQDPFFSVLYSRPKSRLAVAEDLVASMDEAGVDKSVALNIGWAQPELCRRNNDCIMEAQARYPRRIIGFGNLPCGSLENAVEEAERCARGGLRGLGELRPDLLAWDWGNSEKMAPLMDVVWRHRLVLMFHTSEPVGHGYPGKGRATPGTLYPFIAAFPEVTVVLAHWGAGMPFYSLMPEVAEALNHTLFDTAATPFLYRSRVYTAVRNLVGEERILFGSDYPLLSQQRMLREVANSLRSLDGREKVLGGNAARVLGLEGAP